MSAVAIPVITMTTREIAELTGSTHDNVLKTVRSLLGRGVVSANETPYTHPQNGQTYAEFRLSYRDTMVVVSGYSVELRARIIDRWQELEVKQATPAIAVPQTLPEALRLAADLAEQKAQAEAALAIAAPKAVMADQIVHSDDTLAIRDVAKTLGVGERKLFKALRDKGVLLDSVPAALYVQRGYLVEAVHPIELANGETRLVRSARVTGLGIEFIRRFCKRHGLLAEPPQQLPLQKSEAQRWQPLGFKCETPRVQRKDQRDEDYHHSRPADKRSRSQRAELRGRPEDREVAKRL